MTEIRKKMPKCNLKLRSLRLSLKFRPEILRLILKMRHCIRKKKAALKQLKHRLKETEERMTSNDNSNQNTKLSPKLDQIPSAGKPSGDAVDNIIKAQINKEKNMLNPDRPLRVHQSTQTDNITDSKKDTTVLKKSQNKKDDAAWNTENTEQKSIAEQVKEAAQDAMKESGMVYVESAGMYYDYKTGYYYNSELGLYYHTDTGCYYYYSDDKKSFVFHSYPDRSAVDANSALLAHRKKQAKKHKMEKKTEDDIENLTKNLSQDGEDGTQEAKKRKKSKKKAEKSKASESKISDEKEKEVKENIFEISDEEKKDKREVEEQVLKPQELEDGECSDTESEKSDDEDAKSSISTSTASDDDSIAKHHPPCMRVIVRETSLPKLRVGSLFIVTKDGGTIGREGEQHAILLKDTNVSRTHLDIRYDMDRRSYMATDLGSKNGTLLNGSRMSESQVMSEPIEIIHGSTLQLGETKLLCHIHPGTDTCGHCEPGLLMAVTEEKKVAYTRTCSVKKQHELELARLKNKYAPQPLAIEETAYNDRAQARRETIGSSHHSEKTQSADVDTFITPENKGFKLLQKMGWSKGEGLGKESQGDVEPIPMVSNDGTTGLGSSSAGRPPKVKATPLGQATLRLANRTNLLKPPAKAFQQADEDEESE